jgi:hypothetical protein
MTMSVPRAVDLRRESLDGVLDRVERSLQLRLDRETVVRKRRTVGARTDRDTWVRIERRGFDRIGAQGWNGPESAAVLSGVVMPSWYAGFAWREPGESAMWRADEMELVSRALVIEDPRLPDAWWSALNASLDALAAQATPRVATPDTETITQELVTATSGRSFPGWPTPRWRSGGLPMPT